MLALLIALAAAELGAPDAAAGDPAAGMAELRRVYQQSCAERAYGSYNDMCDQMRQQIRAYQRAARSRPAGNPPRVNNPALRPAPAVGAGGDHPLAAGGGELGPGTPAPRP